jgi:hypothetical protein
MEQNELSVLYLVWVPYGIDYFRRFIYSYLKYESGCNHDLVILFNGYGNEENIEEFHTFLLKNDIEYKYLLLEKGQDLLSYRWAAERLATPYILFLNTYCQVLHPNWALNFLKAIQQNDNGCVGATGSWESKASYGFMRLKWIFFPKRIIKNNLPHYVKKEIKLNEFSIFLSPRLSLFAGFIKSVPNIFSYPFFPNPHIRTNAFIIQRDIWLSLKFNSLKNKNKAYQLESGYDSFTRQILKLHKKVMVMDKFGRTYTPENWIYSKTLWTSDQENLLVSDNYTELFQNVSEQVERNKMTKFIWGRLVPSGI